jgi:hypothetical protein
LKITSHLLQSKKKQHKMAILSFFSFFMSLSHFFINYPFTTIFYLHEIVLVALATSTLAMPFKHESDIKSSDIPHCKIMWIRVNDRMCNRVVLQIFFWKYRKYLQPFLWRLLTCFYKCCFGNVIRNLLGIHSKKTEKMCMWKKERRRVMWGNVYQLSYSCILVILDESQKSFFYIYFFHLLVDNNEKE